MIGNDEEGISIVFFQGIPCFEGDQTQFLKFSAMSTEFNSTATPPHAEVHEADSQLDSRFIPEREQPKRPIFPYLLGKEPFRRLRVLRTLASILVFLMCTLLTAYGVSNGWIDPTQGRWLGGLMVASCLFFYVAIRSGWSERFEEPALTLAQVLTAQTFISWAYAVTNEAHGATLILYALVMFFGVFNMDKRSALISGVYVVLASGATMYVKSQSDPVHYPARIELVHFVFIVLTVPVMAYLGTQIADMRNRLKQQKRDLAIALERIQDMAIRDELTGLINRRQALSVLREYRALLKRNKLDVWVVLIDLDHFKRVNDTWGHGVGDEVLRSFAKLATSVLRSADVVARWGGEEFMVVMLEERGADPMVGIERLRSKLTEYQVSVAVPELRMSFSAGLAMCGVKEPTEQVIDRADAALYEAKNRGRNCSVVAKIQELKEPVSA